MIITKEECNAAMDAERQARNTINTFYKQKQDAFKQRMHNNPIFKDEELKYSALQLCPCGHGLAYPTDCSAHHYWDCSAILKGIADESLKHTDRLPFNFYSVKGESDRCGTTRGVIRPQIKEEKNNES